MGCWSLHTHTDDRGCRVYLVPVSSDGRFADAVAVGDPLLFAGPVRITSDAQGRKLVYCDDPPSPPAQT